MVKANHRAVFCCWVLPGTPLTFSAKADFSLTSRPTSRLFRSVITSTSIRHREPREVRCVAIYRRLPRHSQDSFLAMTYKSRRARCAISPVRARTIFRQSFFAVFRNRPFQFNVALQMRRLMFVGSTRTCRHPRHPSNEQIRRATYFRPPSRSHEPACREFRTS